MTDIGTGISRPPAQPQHDAVQLHIATWNLGGMSPEKALDLLSGFQGTPDLSRLQVVFLQEMTTSGGPHFAYNETWMLLHGKRDVEWRGCGVAFLKILGHHESTSIRKAALCTVLRTSDNKALGLLAGHISHRFSIAQTAEALSDWGISPTMSCTRTLLGFDANETFLQPGGALGQTTLSCTGRGEQFLQWALENGVSFPQQSMECPSYYPYNTEMQPRRLDYLAAKGVHVSQIVVGSFRDRARSDHEPILGIARLPLQPASKQGVVWCVRALRHDCQHILGDTHPGPGDLHHSIAEVAKSITIPANRSSKFRESPTLKALRREARGFPPGPESRTAWKSVCKKLQQERKAWKQSLIVRAGSSDWNALRSLKDKQANTNWAAKLLDDPAWSSKLSAHMSSIFCKAPLAQTRGAMQPLLDEVTRQCKVTPWKPFSESEMRITMAKWQNHKATGPDGIALEALKLMFDDDVWRPRIAELLNDSLYRGALPPSATVGASVLLPKCVLPADWSDTRPITLSSAVLKWISQLLLHRGVPLLQPCCQHQWASKGKQGVELLLSLRKLARVAHEWRTPFYIVKIDIAKAFDSIAQEALGELVVRRIAREGGLPWEARLWLSLLEARELTFHVDKRQVCIEQSNGVRQGSPDSPVLFAAKIGEALDATLAAVNGGAPPHVGRHKALEPPPHSGAAFMDDTYVWGESPEYVQQVLAELEVRLRAIGLLINAKKTQVISNIDEDPFRFTIGGKTVKPDGPKAVMTILGAPVTLAGDVAPIVAEMQGRARQAFHKHKKVLCSRAPLKDRLNLHQTLVRGAALWGCPAWPVNASLLQAANSTQLLQLRCMITGKRPPSEAWQDWNKRTMRRARALLHQHNFLRWSTHALQLQWNLWGHIGRAVFAATFHIMRWRDLCWWRDQQALPPGPFPRGVRHIGHHNPDRDPERQIGSVAGPQWWIAASDRTLWGHLQNDFIAKFDPPWASGNQLALPGAPNLAPNTSTTRMRTRVRPERREPSTGVLIVW